MARVHNLTIKPTKMLLRFDKHQEMLGQEDCSHNPVLRAKESVAVKVLKRMHREMFCIKFLAISGLQDKYENCKTYTAAITYGHQCQQLETSRTSATSPTAATASGVEAAAVAYEKR